MTYWRKAGGGSLALSLLVHAGLIALFIAIVTSTKPEPEVKSIPEFKSKQGVEASSDLKQQLRANRQAAMSKTMPKIRVVSKNPDPVCKLPDVPTEAMEPSDMASPMVGGPVSVKPGTDNMFGPPKGNCNLVSHVFLPPSIKGRCDPKVRLQKLKENGGSPECEKAVTSALEYFKAKQNPNGSWGQANRAAMTGFALLCYFGRCETPDSDFYGDNVMKGILYLVELSKSNPQGMMSENPKSNHATYEHGIATYALGEIYSLSRLGTRSLPGVKEAFEKGVKLIIDNQAVSGGWGYGGKGETAYNKAANDLSVTGWQYQALKAAKLSGLKIDGLQASIDKVVKNIESLQSKDGGFGNTGTGAYNQWSLSGVGILGLQTFATNKTALIKKGLKFSYDFQTKEPPIWASGNVADHARPTLYGWYYYAQCYFQNGGAEMKFWNETALPEILKHQNKDGSWTGTGAILTAGGDNVFTTALCTLMLEVYYRVLAPVVLAALISGVSAPLR
ncbi:MAG: hypothetical protein K8R87_07270 [Verrucomicrobia bacterium]|nr:hypothetical protein [Verrucomicrobiota bacterium]